MRTSCGAPQDLHTIAIGITSSNEKKSNKSGLDLSWIEPLKITYMTFVKPVPFVVMVACCKILAGLVLLTNSEPLPNSNHVE